ncbi:MBL fold metallo-hydrolase OS=Streptomyces fumanus OX=67302 GN=GCM10018772_20480 PE=3 SV=1 [Streptomyces fumanus]
MPTFPNATYLMPKDDFDFWNPENGHEPVLGRGNQNVFEDSVSPVHRAGLDAAVGGQPPDRRRAAPGRGSRTHPRLLGADPHLWDDCGAVFVGAGPAAQPGADPRTGRQQLLLRGPRGRPRRRKVLGWAADHNALVVPAHLGGHGAAEVVREGSKFAIKGWAPFAPYTERA